MKNIISLITLGVEDFEKSIRFYRDGLGFPTHNYEEGDDHVMFQMESSWLGLFPKEKLAKGAGVEQRETGFSGIVFAHNVKTKEEVDRVYKFILDAGAKSLKKPQEVFWGGYECHFSDPDGYVWAVAYNPFTDLS